MTDTDDEGEQDGETTVQEKIINLFKQGSGPARAESVGRPVGGYETYPVNVEIDAEDVAWLVGKLGDNGELHAEELRLSTTEGEFVFEAEDDRLIVTHDREEETDD